MTRSSDSRLYFAYVAMLNPETIRRRGMKLEPRTGRRARLPDYQLMFDHRAGFGNLVRVSTGKATEAPPVHGVVYEVDATDWAKLEKSEVGYRCEEFEVEVEVEDGSSSGSALVRASAFVSEPRLRIVTRDPASCLPTQRYIDLIRRGADYHELDGSYREWLGSLGSVPSIQPAMLDTAQDRWTRVGLGLAVLIAALLWYH